MSAWFWFAIIASILWGLSYVFSQYALRVLNPVEILLITSILMTILLCLYMTFTHQWQDLFSRLNSGYKLPLSVLIYALIYFTASLFILQSIRIGDASLAAVVESSYPLFTIFFAYVILKEAQVNWGVIIGAATVLVGLAIIYFTSEKLPPMH